MSGPLFAAVANQTVILYPLATAIPSSASMAEALKYTTADTAVIAPPMVVEIATNPELLEFLSKKISVIMFGGGDLPQAFGDVVTSRFKFYTSNGSTETGYFHSFVVLAHGRQSIGSIIEFIPWPTCNIEKLSTTCTKALS
jgi:hypothetical protein